MSVVARVCTGIAVLVLSVLAWPHAAAASAAAARAPEGEGLVLSLRTAQPTYGPQEQARLIFTVSNSGAPCGLAQIADGTVQVVSVRRDGVEVVPALVRSFYEDGIGSELRVSLVQEPQVDVVLTAIAMDDDTLALRSVAVSPGGDTLDALWPVSEPGQYEVAASYAVPSVDGACVGVTGTQTVAFTITDREDQGVPWWYLAIAVALLLFLVVLVIVLIARRRRVGAAAVLVLLVAIGAVGVDREPAFADYTVDPTRGIPTPGDFKAQVAACMAMFEMPGNDPSGILPRLKDPKTPNVTIIPTTGGSNTFETPKSKAGKGSSVITWNPTSTDEYSDGVARDPCSALYHELNHADDISRDKVPGGECDDTGIRTAEVKATFAENAYRKAKGLPLRTEYDGKKLPKSMNDCKKPPTKKPPAKGPTKLCEASNNCGSTNGDPHLITFDRRYYDFQAVGEFVVARSTAGDGFEVQARQAPMGSSRTVAVNTAVAFRVATARLELALVAGVTQLRLDGELVTIEPGTKSLPGGGSLERRDSDLGRADGYDVHWPDGTTAAVDPIGPYGFRLLITLAGARAGAVEGLLGNFDGDPSNDLAPAPGTALPEPVTFADLYPSYADSWRITQADSLFTYASGQGTQDFTDPTFPDQPMTVADLSADQRAEAERVCRWAGVTGTWQLAECILDVAASGRPEFAVSSAGTENVAPALDAPIVATPIAVATLTAGGSDRLTFAGKQGQVVFVDFTGSTLPNSCSPLHLLDPSGTIIGRGCSINGTGYVDREPLPADGDYTVVIDPGDGATGRATARVYLVQDTTGGIEPNGPEQTATFEQPGSVARWTFTGSAGQRAFVDVEQSTLPNQCSPLRLLDASGHTLQTGCVINGTGEVEGTVLEQDGTFTVEVDPVERTTGTARVRVYLANDQVGTITVNGPPVVATIGQPGSVVRLSFAAEAGISVAVTASDGTLPDQCSPLRLIGPDGATLGTGCVINGTGDIQRTVLPVAGTYEVVVDPPENATGSVTLTLQT